MVEVHSDRVYGRKPVIELVRDLMAREQRGRSLRSQRFPILVVEGFRGAGKTALLDTLVDLLEQRVPYARLDFEANKHASVPQVLSALAFELNRKCPRYGALQFPRFIIGQLVTRLELDLTDHTQACRQVVLTLERHREVDKLRDVLEEAAGSVLQTVGRGTGMDVEPSTRLVGLTLKWLTARAPRRVSSGSSKTGMATETWGYPMTPSTHWWTSTAGPGTPRTRTVSGGSTSCSGRRSSPTCGPSSTVVAALTIDHSTVSPCSTTLTPYSVAVS